LGTPLTYAELSITRRGEATVEAMATTNIFVNLAVNDLKASRAFYTAVGYTINELFSDENAICVVLGENLYAMLLLKPFFSTFTDKQLIEPKTQVQALNALSVESREEVDEWVAKALTAGGREPKPARDLGFMYSRDVEDPDGHIWEVLWMEPSAIENGPS
jgi:uncharacterized protein